MYMQLYFILKHFIHDHMLFAFCSRVWFRHTCSHIRTKRQLQTITRKWRAYGVNSLRVSVVKERERIVAWRFILAVVLTRLIGALAHVRLAADWPVGHFRLQNVRVGVFTPFAACRFVGSGSTCVTRTYTCADVSTLTSLTTIKCLFGHFWVP